MLINKLDKFIHTGKYCVLCACLLARSACAEDFRITSQDRDGLITWANAFTNGVVALETGNVVAGGWSVQQNFFTTNSFGSARAPLSLGGTFVRLLMVDISTNTPRHYTNLLESYGILETVAGPGSEQFRRQPLAAQL